mmetsp:Transcript_10673/g.27946  ORF Transcript_10673/g.27946 Transcript_10673/m.27946 type:complete len:100 (-) Transcript_10673:38-337(-)
MCVRVYVCVCVCVEGGGNQAYTHPIPTLSVIRTGKKRLKHGSRQTWCEAQQKQKGKIRREKERAKKRIWFCLNRTSQCDGRRATMHIPIPLLCGLSAQL